jgi:hypothetical protein
MVDPPVNWGGLYWVLDADPLKGFATELGWRVVATAFGVEEAGLALAAD